MTGGVLWWSVLAAGILLLTAAGVASTTLGSRGRRVRRLGFFPPRHVRPPRAALAGIFFGILLITFAAGMLSETGGSYSACFGAAVGVSLLVQAVAGWRHNRRRAPDTAPGGTAGGAG